MIIEEVFVKKKYRRKGLGRQLVAFAEELAMKNGLSNIQLRPYLIDPSDMANSELIGWYKKQGYSWMTKDWMSKATKVANNYA